MSDAATSLLTPWRGTVLPEWTDYNGHLRDAHYLLVFSMATDAMIDRKSTRLNSSHSSPSRMPSSA